MPYETIVSCETLAEKLGQPNWAIFDCRFSMDDAEQGQREYLQAHIPGAVYTHLEKDLCGLPVEGKTSRHPFPEVDEFADTLSKWGIDEDVQVVVYDDQYGGFAVRLWRMLGWLGHDKVALLDGGWGRWQKLGLPVKAGEESRPKRQFTARPRPELIVNATAIEDTLKSGETPLIDTRSERSFTGQKAPDSPSSGHIPGAHHFYFPENLDADGLLKNEYELRMRYEKILQGHSAENAIVYCTSGVTASLNILALKHLGLGEAKLFAGSWDEWIMETTRPVQKSISDSKAVSE